jgi:hypothetical protein
MPETYTQNVSGCMAGRIGDDGLTDDALETASVAAWDVWSAMRRYYRGWISGGFHRTAVG